MRLFPLAGVSAFLCLGVVACSSGTDEQAASQDPTAPSPTEQPAPTAPPEPPIGARPVCAAVAADAKTLGRGCSGTGYNDSVCVVSGASSSCGTNACIFDGRGESTFSLTCAPTCTVGSAEACPLGFECVDTTADCSGAKTGVCAPTATCAPGVKASQLFEGAAGELYGLDFDGKTAKLFTKRNGVFPPVVTFDTTSSPSVSAVVRNGTRVLVVTSTHEILLENGKGVATPRAKPANGSYDGAFGVAADGRFVKLDQPNDSFAALSRRNDDGTWTEVGPTRQRLKSVRAMGKGFLALCQGQLCASTDGESFTPVAPPPGVTFDEKTTWSAAGLAADDFYFTARGQLFRFKKGVWVEEGPRAPELPATTSSGYADKLVVGANGTAAFHTWNGTSYTTYVSVAGCWRVTPSGYASSAIVGDALAYTNVESKLCTVPIR